VCNTKKNEAAEAAIDERNSKKKATSETDAHKRNTTTRKKEV
jgi:hypothetical protein